MQILLINSKKTTKELLTINIKSFLGVDVISRTSAVEGIELLNLLPEIDLIITQESKDNEQTAQMIEKHVQEQKSNIPIIVLSSNKNENNWSNLYYIKENDWELVIKESARILGLSENILRNQNKSDYVEIPVEYFLNIDSSSCDVYIRITKDKDDFQFIKRIHAGDTYSKVVIQRYIEQGLKYFFVTGDKFEIFSISLSNQLVKKLNQEMNSDEDIELLGNAFDVATKEILGQGFNSSTIQLTEAIVKSVIDSYKTFPNVSVLLRKVLNSKTGYIYQHAHLCTIVASEICANLNLNSKNQIDKFALASVFKDISLVDDESLAEISTAEELEACNLSEDKWEQVFNHALAATTLVRNFPEAPLDVDNIIKHHHTSQNGKGFQSEDSYQKLDFDSLLFAITVEFVNELLRFKKHGGEPRPLIQELNKKYTTDDAIKIIKALEKSLKKSSVQ